MPIYEFRCCDCEDLFELLVLSEDERLELKCPRCESDNFERVMSTTNFCMGAKSTGVSGAGSQTRTCPGGSCTTYEVPGPSR